MRALTAIAVTFAVLSFPESAGASTNPVVTASNALPGATTSLDLNFSNYQTSTAVRCIRADFTGGYKPQLLRHGFDSSIEGWSVGWGADSVYSDTNSHQGSRSLGLSGTYDGSTRYVSAGSPDGGPSNITASGDTLSAWVRLPAGTSGTWRANIRVQDASYTLTPTGAQTTLSSGNWVRVVQTFTPSQLTSVRRILVEIESSGYTGSSNIAIDQIEQGPSASSQVDGVMPTGLNLGSFTSTGSFINNQAWTRDTSGASSGSIVIRNATGVTPTATNASLVFGSITQPTASAGQSVFVTVTTYSATGSGVNCGGAVLDSPITFAYVTSTQTTVSVAVDPTMSFSVAGYTSGSCNGATINRAGSSGTAVDLGNLNSSTNAIGAQALTVASNAAGGARVLVRSSGLLSDGRGNDIDDVVGTNSAPQAFPTATEAFGYTTDGTLSSSAIRFQTNKWARFTSVDQEVLFGTASASTTGHVCLQAAVTPATSSGAYATTVVYTAVPTY